MAAAEPVDLEKLKVKEEAEDEVMEDVEENEEEGEEGEEDAALEDVKDLYEDDDEEGTGKKRKRASADDGADQKSGKKKVIVPHERLKKHRELMARNRLWLYHSRGNVNLINLSKMGLRNVKNQVQKPKTKRYVTLSPISRLIVGR